MAESAYHPAKTHPLLPKFIWNYATTEYVEIRVEGQTAFVNFRGSDDPVDWVRNADMHFVDTAQGGVHHGLRRGWLELLAPVVAQLNLMDILQVVITGHSRGGGIGIQCHEYLSREHPELVTSTVTFGCPLMCNEEWEESCWNRDLDIVNYINGYDWIPFFRDPIPHLPLSMSRPGADIYLGGFGRPARMHRIATYVNRLGQ
jgi:hypothetical protein